MKGFLSDKDIKPEIKDNLIVFKDTKGFKGWYLIKGIFGLRNNCEGQIVLKFLNGKEKVMRLPISKSGNINFIFRIKELTNEIKLIPCADSVNFKIIKNPTIKKLSLLERFLRFYRRILPLFFHRNLANNHLKKFIKLKLINAVLNPTESYYKISYGRHLRTCIGISYEEFIKIDELTDEEKQLIQKKSKKLKTGFSFLIPVEKENDITLLQRTIDSFKKQIYNKWEVFIGTKNKQLYDKINSFKDSKIKILSENNFFNSFLNQAENEFLGLLFPGDELLEKSIYCIASFLKENKEANIVYTDSDFKLNSNRCNPLFKPDWNKEYFLSYDYIKNLVLFRKDILNKINGFREEMGTYLIYDALLRATKYTDSIFHIPQILCHHLMEKPEEDWDKGLQALKEFFQSTPEIKSIAKGNHPHTFRIIWSVPNPEPFVSIVIPTKNKFHLISKCIDSIFNKTSYKNYEIVIVDNGTKEPKALKYLKSLSNNEKVKILRYDIPFNFSSLANYGIKNSTGDIIVLLNNDVEVISENWLEEMVSYAVRKDVGVVGGKLLYPDGKIQHAGVIIGLWGVADHAFKGCENKADYMLRATLPQEYLAVTAACMALRREVFDEVGGFDEKKFPVNFNDTDFCLRVRERGYKIVFTPYALLYHHEHATKGKDRKKEQIKRNEKEKKNFRKRWNKYISYDPFYNPNLSFFSNNFSLTLPKCRKF